MTTVLVVEDEPTIRGLVAEALADEGYAVEQAADGLEALRKTVEHPPDVVLLDLKLPTMSGEEYVGACRRFARCRDVPVVVMSAAYDASEWCRKLGVEACLPKPFELDELAAVVHRLAA